MLVRAAKIGKTWKRIFQERQIVMALCQKKSFNHISRTLKVSKKRIKNIFGQAQKLGYLTGKSLPPAPAAVLPLPPPVLNKNKSKMDKLIGQHLAFIQERLAANYHIATIWETFPEPNISRTTFYRFIKQHCLKEHHPPHHLLPRVIPEYAQRPGEVLFLDWGKMMNVTDPLARKNRPLYFLTGILGHSRYLMVRLVWNKDQATTLEALESMFTEMGGVPAKIISDNPPCFVQRPSYYEPELNLIFSRFCAHYHIMPELAPPPHPKAKAKVDRMIPYIRRLFEGYGPSWHGIAHAQAYLNQRLKIANLRRHGSTQQRPSEVFRRTEKPRLRKLPAAKYHCEECRWSKVRQDGHVRFKDKYYSVEKKYLGCEVLVLGNQHTVRIYYNGTLIATHRRLHQTMRHKSTKIGHLEPYEQTMTNHHNLEKQAARIGPAAAQLARAILKNNLSFFDRRKVWGILNLAQKYPVEEVERACAAALAQRDLSFRGVEAFFKTLPSSHQKNMAAAARSKARRRPKECLANTNL